LLTALTGAETALVVNNAAAGLVLALNTVGRGHGVAVSRGELVEIGGGFRIPEVLERAGARLVEVGSTNRTRVADYEAALSAGDPHGDGGPSSEPDVRAILKVHRSNFRMSGFTEEASLEELSALARRRGLPLIHDLGSGLMIDAARLGLPDEPTTARSITAGADVVVVSGDKLLGGPQAGLVMGSEELVDRMRKNPLCRALRVDKVTLAGLEATLRAYRDPERALAEIPTLRMLSASVAALAGRAEEIRARLETTGIMASVVETSGAVGGGTYPGVELVSRAVELRPDGVDRVAERLRHGDPPVVGRIVDDALLLDVRTVLPGQEDDLVRRVAEALGSGT
jgi:L-seryl-tRNA(Ser) seleniumtransferase